MLKPGAIIQCAKESTRTVPPIKDDTKSPVGVTPSLNAPKPGSFTFGGVTDAEIDDYLASYGKPPRAAVRALLNPTDDNIATMAAEEKRRQVIAAYVAQRWTEFQQGKVASATNPTLDAYTTLPLFVGMRLLLLVTPDCKECPRIAKAVKGLVEENPVLDGRLIVVSDDESAALDTLLQFGTSLPVSTVSVRQARSLGWTIFPAAEITDTKHQRQRMVTGNLSGASLRNAVIEMRKSKTAAREGVK